MLDLIPIAFESTATGIEILVKPLHPCKLGRKVEKIYQYNPYPEVLVAGEPGLDLGRIIPYKIFVSHEHIDRAKAYTLLPFYFVSRRTGLKIESLGQLIQDEKQLCQAKQCSSQSSQA